MIMYKRTEWYGLMYLTTMRGSLLPKMVPPSLFAALISILIHMDKDHWHVLNWSSDPDEDTPLHEWLTEAYGISLFGIVFGYLCVTRINMSYARYWEGVTQVKTMHSKWADACGQVLVFDRMRHPACDIRNEPFCRHVVRLFSQLSAMATMRLHVSDPGDGIDLASIQNSDVDEEAAENFCEARRNSARSSFTGSGSRMSSPDVSTTSSWSRQRMAAGGREGTRSLHVGQSVRICGALPQQPNPPKSDRPKSSRPSPGAKLGACVRRISYAISPSHASIGPADSASGRGAASDRGAASARGADNHASLRRQSQVVGMRRQSQMERLNRAATCKEFACREAGLAPLDIDESSTMRQKNTQLAQGLSPAEIAVLDRAPCPVLATALRIQRAIITRHDSGGVRAPPPIVSRIFQEISNGLLAYNNATKLKEVPVPFAYVQFNALLLLLFTVLAPVAVACFTPKSVILSAVTSFIVVGSFTAIWLVANEMEDPFGCEANDMPMLSYHEEFCASIAAMLISPWLPDDQWLVAEGKWVDPKNLTAFCGVGTAAFRRRSSLLEKAKCVNNHGGRWAKACLTSVDGNQGQRVAHDERHRLLHRQHTGKVSLSAMMPHILPKADSLQDVESQDELSTQPPPDDGGGSQASPCGSKQPTRVSFNISDEPAESEAGQAMTVVDPCRPSPVVVDSDAEAQQ